MGVGAAIAIGMTVIAAVLVIGGFLWAAWADGRDQEARERRGHAPRFPARRRR